MTNSTVQDSIVVSLYEALGTRSHTRKTYQGLRSGQLSTKLHEKINNNDDHIGPSLLDHSTSSVNATMKIRLGESKQSLENILLFGGRG